MGDFDKVSPGSLSENAPSNRASWLNKVSSMAARYYGQEDNGAAGKGGQNFKDADTWVKVQNLVEYGDTPVPIDLLRGHVVQLDAYLLDELDPRNLWFEGKLYSSSANGRIAILRRATEIDEIAKAQLIGVCTALVNVTDTGHRFAEPENGKYILRSATSGPVEILSPLDSTGVQEVAVFIGQGGITNHFQIIRGSATAAVSPTDPAFQVESITAYEQYASTPSEPTWVKAPPGGVTLSEGQTVWAIYRQNVLTFDPGGGDVQVDWLMFEPGSSNLYQIRFLLNSHRSRQEPIPDSFAVSVLDDGDNIIAQATVYDTEHRYFGRAGFIGEAVHNGESYKCISLEDLPQFALVRSEAIQGFLYESGSYENSAEVLATSGPPDMERYDGQIRTFDEHKQFINISKNDVYLAMRRPRTTNDAIPNPEQESREWNYHAIASPLGPEMIWAWSEQTAADETTPVFAHETRRTYVGRRIKLYTGYGQSWSNQHYKDLGPIKFFFPDGSTPTLRHKQRLTGFQVFYDLQGHDLEDRLYVITGGTGSPLRFGVTGTGGLTACVYSGTGSSGYADMGFGSVYPWRRSPNPSLPRRIERDPTEPSAVEWLNSMADPVCANRPVTGMVDGGQVICIAEGWTAVA